MKKLILLFFVGLFLNISYAQKKKNVYFLKADGSQASENSADVIRIIEEPDSGKTNYELTEYYKNRKIKTRGAVSEFSPKLVYEGSLVNYDDRGVKRSVFSYEQNKLVNKGYYFFANGKLKKIVDYDGFGEFKPESGMTWSDQPFKVEYFADSLGNIMVNEGKGHYKETVMIDEKAFILEGDYNQGLKDGLWSQTSTSGDWWYKDRYLKGKFLSGESFKDGQSHLYEEEIQEPGFKGGIEAFYRYLDRSVHYPTDAQRKRIEGKVYLSFVIEKDGTLTSIKVERGLSPSIDDEAVRVLRQSPPWIAAKQRGLPTRIKYNIPIGFKLRE